MDEEVVAQARREKGGSLVEDRAAVRGAKRGRRSRVGSAASRNLRLGCIVPCVPGPDRYLVCMLLVGSRVRGSCDCCRADSVVVTTLS